MLVAALLDTRVRTVERIWKLAKDQVAQGEPIDVSNKKKGRVGRKKADLGLSWIPAIPLNKRRTVRALARSLGCSYTALHRRFEWKQVKRRSSSLKPTLKAANKIARMQFCISMLDESTLGNDSPTFQDMSKSSILMKNGLT